MSLLLSAVAASFLLPGQAPTHKKPLDPSVYDSWKSIRGTAFTRDGQWITYSVAAQEGDGSAVLRHVDDGKTITVERAIGFRFSKDSKFAVGLVSAPFADLKKARRDKAKPEDMPKSNLVIVNLATGEKTTIDRVQSFELSAEDSGWLLYRPEPPLSKPPESGAGTTPSAPQRAGRSASATTTGAAAPQAKTFSIVVRRLDTGKEETLKDVTAFVLDKPGDALLYEVETTPASEAKQTDSKADKGSSEAPKEGEKPAAPKPPALKTTTLMLELILPGTRAQIASGKVEFPQIALSTDGHHVAYYSRPLSDPPKKDAPPKAPATSTLYLYQVGDKNPTPIGADSAPKSWTFDDKNGIRFSEKATRLIYTTYPTPTAPPKELPDDEKVSVDIWTWKDPLLQPQQLLQADAEQKRGYTAIYDLASKKSRQIGEVDLPNVEISDKGDGWFALATTDVPYRREGSWDPGYEDTVVVDLSNGKFTTIAKRHKGPVVLSPTGKYVALFDGAAARWTLYDCIAEKERPITGIPFPLYDELHDVPDEPGPYGIRGWTKNDTAVVIADRFDLWAAPTDGKGTVKRLTFGRDLGAKSAPIALDPEHPELDLDHLLLSTSNELTKQGGVALLDHGSVKKLLLDDKTFGGFVKAKDADRMAYTRQDFVEFPDLWVTDSSFSKPTKISNANPQQAEYNWGKAELVNWTSLDGAPLQGILIKPEDFDYGKRYPLVTYFYERMSESLNTYHPPAPSASTINWSYLASNGYCIFIPDIPYRTGYPGYSALSAIVPGVQSIVNRGYIDPKRLGIQGQSWGGYQVAYLVTQTNMFAAAEAGAPVGDMFSAYGGIRYGSGLVREFQYEHEQSRIGGTPWDSTLKFIENSPVFFADKVQTPLMIMSNDKDGAVPHTQGIELFTALRRLDKPCWMVVYNGEDHNIMERKNRKDFTIRLSQFFDHFLKGAPMPVWMSKGVPAVYKGKTMGLELEKQDQ